jgi:RNA polymerase sigma-70 factor (ECF subfamily)
MSERPFAELMTSLRDGDPQAAEAVWERFARRLTALAATRLPDVLRGKADPEDIIQSVFKSFFARHADARLSVDSWDNLWTLLTVLTVRKCGHRVQHFQAACRDVRRETPPTDPDTSNPAWEVAAPEPTPAEAVLLAETLNDLLQGLKPEHRTIVQLRLQGYTIEEISQLAGCTERTAYRVLEKVRARLSGQDTEGDPA